jgi:hypothetical protein
MPAENQGRACTSTSLSSPPVAARTIPSALATPIHAMLLPVVCCWASALTTASLPRPSRQSVGEPVVQAQSQHALGVVGHQLHRTAHVLAYGIRLHATEQRGQAGDEHDDDPAEHQRDLHAKTHLAKAYGDHGDLATGCSTTKGGAKESCSVRGSSGDRPAPKKAPGESPRPH